MGRHLRQLVRGQRVERRPLRQKAGDLAQTRVQLALRWLLRRIADQRYATPQRSSPNRCARCT
ncbi:MAG: hypothetical protein ACXVSA_21485, partial [Solirubrobacteraceae bacterium]